MFVPASQSGMPKDSDLGQMVKQKVKLRVTEVNRARRRVVGSIKSVLNEERQAAQAAIWEGIEVGKHYDGVVKSMTSYGVFVDIGGVDGMVHISELSWSRIKNPAEVVSIGDHLDVYVISFDPEKRTDFPRRQGSHPEPLGCVHEHLQGRRCCQRPHRQADDLRRVR
ncbi:MAG: S1 RNA-binding domain-containing protein [Oscillibacter sp.]